MGSRTGVANRPKINPSALHKTICMPMAASRKRQRTTAGKFWGTSLISTRPAWTSAVRIMKIPTDAIAPFQAPKRCISHWPSRMETAMTQTDSKIMPKYVTVRRPMVSSRPTAGGLGGYLRSGISTKVRNPAPACSNAKARGDSPPTRP